MTMIQELNNKIILNIALFIRMIDYSYLIMADKKALQLGNRLSLLRKRKNMTLDELSAKSGVSKSILSQIERDLSNPTVTTIPELGGSEESYRFFFKD